MEGREPAVIIEDLVKYYGEELVLDHLNMSIDKGESVGIAGPNGAGKSTLLKIIAGIEEATSGQVIVRGRAGLVPQEILLLPWRTLRGNILLAAKLGGIPREKARETIEWGSRILGLDDYLDKRPGQVSGGTRRKAQILMALVLDPDILLLDEPFTGLDQDTITALQEAIRRLSRDKGMTIVTVSHMLDEVMTIANRLYVLTHKPAKIKKIINLK
ncbi:MAG: ATP-binding cassette domain-containing protein [Desulfurococcales archaeon]|nr:ATP-binding cassette domain-containing protein [Desulfurococcales archaeon]